ncbi:MAG TPA: DUF202 domain-containing protein [Streptosporangiaceae bacterium]|nr:DUF202 domain-containing protein [Streptosporangiaceae bacterium]
MKTEPDDPGIADPADRTRLAWSRTAIAFTAIGAAMLKLNPVVGVVVIALTMPIWAAGHATSVISSARRLRLVTLTVVVVAAAALAAAFLSPGPATLAELLHGR